MKMSLNMKKEKGIDVEDLIYSAKIGRSTNDAIEK